MIPATNREKEIHLNCVSDLTQFNVKTTLIFKVPISTQLNVKHYVFDLTM